MVFDSKKLRLSYVPSVQQERTLDNENGKKISIIAELIGCALTVCPHDTPRPSCLTTIAVHQSKNKFGEVRVYCHLADPDLVKKSWDSMSDSDREKRGAYDDHAKKRLVTDAHRYRVVYRSVALGLFPQFYWAIRRSADYPVLLCESREELDELLDSGYHTGWDASPESRSGLYKICSFGGDTERSKTGVERTDVSLGGVKSDG